MKLTAKVKLNPTVEQFHALKKTMEVANLACNYISEQAWNEKLFSRVPLHHLVYYPVREKFELSAQVVVRCISKVVDAYKTGHKTQRNFRPFGAISYDDRILGWKEHSVSIWTVDGREKIPFVCGERQKELLQSRQGESNLAFINNEFYLLATCDIEEPEPQDVHDVLGCDLGIVNLVATSDGEIFSGKDIEENRRKYEHRRKNLQKKQTKSAKRKLKKISGKQHRYQKHTNHVISKQLVKNAQDTNCAIALEDLKGIPNSRKRFRRKQRNKFSNWSFYQLQQYIKYKAKLAGIPVIMVDPKNTSRTCPVCGCVDKANRSSQSLFSCIQCGFSANADYVASLNIRDRAIVNLPMVSALQESGTMPRLLVAG